MLLVLGLVACVPPFFVGMTFLHMTSGRDDAPEPVVPIETRWSVMVTIGGVLILAAVASLVLTVVATVATG